MRGVISVVEKQPVAYAPHKIARAGKDLARKASVMLQQVDADEHRQSERPGQNVKEQKNLPVRNQCEQDKGREHPLFTAAALLGTFAQTRRAGALPLNEHVGAGGEGEADQADPPDASAGKLGTNPVSHPARLNVVIEMMGNDDAARGVATADREHEVEGLVEDAAVKGRVVHVVVIGDVGDETKHRRNGDPRTEWKG